MAYIGYQNIKHKEMFRTAFQFTFAYSILLTWCFRQCEIHAYLFVKYSTLLLDTKKEAMAKIVFNQDSNLVQTYSWVGWNNCWSYVTKLN